MGYLDNTIVTVDAILTKKGRELLARGDGSFFISQFALSDDDVDYGMFNPNHPSGSAYYGEAIENMPVLEAFPDETQIMKYLLTTLPRGTSKLPVLNVGTSNIILKQGAAYKLTPETLNYLGATNVFEAGGYIATVADIRVFSDFTGVGISSPEVEALNISQTVGTNVSKTVIGTTINIRATTVNTLFGTRSQLQTTLTVVGRDSGARVTLPVTITKAT